MDIDEPASTDGDDEVDDTEHGQAGAEVGSDERHAVDVAKEFKAGAASNHKQVAAAQLASSAMILKTHSKHNSTSPRLSCSDLFVQKCRPPRHTPGPPPVPATKL